MLFNSYIFLFVFAPLVMWLWWSQWKSISDPGRRIQFRLVALTLASYLFYGYADPSYCTLMLVSTCIDYVAGQKIAHPKSRSYRKAWLALSIASNLALLGFFKYAGFFAESINGLTESLGGNAPLSVLDIVLPVGISFYTFQSMSYSIDIYRGQAKPAPSFWHFAAYVSMFPQLIAGPIVRYSDLEDQFRAIKAKADPEMFRRGLEFFIMGLVKKILIADAIASMADPLWATSDQLQFAGSWLAALGYTLQIYFDFSAYSDMAVGLGLMLGFSFPQNFNSPYKARNVSDFWRRWHISLSTWLRDYLYISLGGSRRGTIFTLRNLLITMFLGGLWHGAAWTFVIWGIYHGLLLVIHHTASRLRSSPLPLGLGYALTFIAVVFGWVIFRAESFDQALDVASNMVGLGGFEALDQLFTTHKPKVFGAIAAGLAFCFMAPNTWQVRFGTRWYYTLAFAALFIFCVLKLGEDSPFLYFRF